MSGIVDGDDYSNLSRKELQDLSKCNGLPDNRSNSDLISSLAPCLEGPMQLEDPASGIIREYSIFAKHDRTKLVSLDGIETYKANVSSAKTSEESPHKNMEFRAWDGKGLNPVFDLNVTPSDWIDNFKHEVEPICGSIPQSSREDLGLLDENNKERIDAGKLDNKVTGYTQQQQGDGCLVSSLQKKCSADVNAALLPGEDLSLLDENSEQRRSSFLHIIDVNPVFDLNATPSDWIDNFKHEVVEPICGSVPQSPREDLGLLDENNKEILDDKVIGYNQQQKGDECLVSSLQKKCGADASAALLPGEELSLDENSEERRSYSLHTIDVVELNYKDTSCNQLHHGDEFLVLALQKPCDADASAALLPREDLSLLDKNCKDSSLHIIDVDELDDKITGYNQQHQGATSLVSALKYPCGADASVKVLPRKDLVLSDENAKGRKNTSLSLHIIDVDEPHNNLTGYNRQHQGDKSLISALQKPCDADTSAALSPREKRSLLDERCKERKNPTLHIIDVDELDDKLSDYNQQHQCDTSLVLALETPCADATATLPPRDGLGLLGENSKETKNSSLSLHIIDVDELDDNLTGYNQHHQGDKSSISALQKSCGADDTAALSPLGLILKKHSSEAENGGLVHVSELNLDSHGNPLQYIYKDQGAGKYDGKNNSECSQLENSFERMSSRCLESETVSDRKREGADAADQCADDNLSLRFRKAYQRKRFRH